MVCAEHLARTQPGLIRDLVGKLGDMRMTARAARIESLFTASPPDAVLYTLILDALGYVANRDPMAAIARYLPWHVLSAICGETTVSFDRICAALLGTGGFMPMSDREVAHSGLAAERAHNLAGTWNQIARDWSLAQLPPTDWSLARIRPPNHPIRRLVQAAALIAGSDLHLSATLMGPLRAGFDPTDTMIEIVAGAGAPALGLDRARAITTNVLVSFAFAIASQNEDVDLAEQVSRVWESLPGAESNERTRRAIRQVTGEVGMKRVGARLQQGLIHLDRSLCEPRRCYECPIAAVVVREPSAPERPLG
jgi:hypothetical protein